MRKIIQISIFGIFLFHLLACEKQSAPSLMEINLEQAADSPAEIKCSDFIESFEYVPLETNDSCLINNAPTISVVGDKLVVQTLYDCFIFNRYTGKYIQRIANQGRGPGEYQSTLRIVDPLNKTVFFQRGGGEILEYSLQNKFIGEFSIPTYDGSFENPSMPTVYTSYKNWLLCYFTNLLGDEEKLLMAVNRNTGLPDFIIPNRKVYERHELSFISSNEADFYTFNNQQFFKENYNDTIFSVQDSILNPHIVIHTGKYWFSPMYKWDRGVDKSEFITPRNIMESDKYLYFEYFRDREPYIALFSKEDNELVVAPSNEGILNDVDDFVRFSPRTSVADNIIIGSVDAYKVSEWFSEHSMINDLPTTLQNLKNIQETDNPVVMIAKLKE